VVNCGLSIIVFQKKYKFGINFLK